MGYELETSEFLSFSFFCNASKNNQFDNAKIIYSDENSVFLKQ